MKSQMKLPHQKITTYIAGHKDAVAGSEIDKITAEDPVYELLFHIIRECRAKVDTSQLATTKHELNFTELEDIIRRIISNPHLEDAQVFLEYLLFSPDSYRRILQKLSFIAPRLDAGEFAELAVEYGIEIKSDEELLSQILEEAPPIETPQPAASRQPVYRPVATSRFEVIFSKIPGIITRYRWALSGALAAVLLLVVFLSPPAYPPYAGIWKETLPYEFSPDNFRSSEAFRALPQSSQGRYLVLGNFVEATMLIYKDRNYKGVIDRLGQAEDLTKDLQKWAQNPLSAYTPEEIAFVKGTRKLVQKFYFLSGISHLAYSTEKDKSLNFEDRTYYQEQAVELLNKAREVAVAFNITTDDRELYFLGLSYKFSGQFKKAITAFRGIHPDSRFKRQAEAQLDEIRKFSS